MESGLAPSTLDAVRHHDIHRQRGPVRIRQVGTTPGHDKGVIGRIWRQNAFITTKIADWITA